MSAHRLAVWGDPIAHSRSPQLHAAAYDALGLAWHYGRRRVNADEFAAALGGLDDTWRGLSLTMPLKEVAFRAAHVRDRHAELTGAVNTLVWGVTPRGFNTDVGGIVDALGEGGAAGAERVRVLGAGATAASALVAVSEMGARRVEVRARNPDRARALVTVGERMGVAVSLAGFDDPAPGVDVTLATLPSGARLPAHQADVLAAGGGVLFEAAYAPWPSSLAAQWHEGPVVSGLLMLLHQAVRQVRAFVHGDTGRPLPDEATVLARMRSAVMGD